MASASMFCKQTVPSYNPDAIRLPYALILALVTSFSCAHSLLILAPGSSSNRTSPSKDPNTIRAYPNTAHKMLISAFHPRSYGHHRVFKLNK
eukprot:IDg14648t1